jgi:hypothetical protein
VPSNLGHDAAIVSRAAGDSVAAAPDVSASRADHERRRCPAARSPRSSRGNIFGIVGGELNRRAGEFGGAIEHGEVYYRATRGPRLNGRNEHAATAADQEIREAKAETIATQLALASGANDHLAGSVV